MSRLEANPPEPSPIHTNLAAAPAEAGARKLRPRKRPVAEITPPAEAAPETPAEHPPVEPEAINSSAFRPIHPAELYNPPLPAIRPAPPPGSDSNPEGISNTEKIYHHWTVAASSMDDSYKKRQKRLQQNRAAAAASRNRKKVYMEGLEHENASLKAEIVSLRQRLGISPEEESLPAKVATLTTEINLLKARLGLRPEDPV
jgi:hypothetical protein